MNNFTFQNPVKLIFGKGSIAKLAKEIPADKKIMVTFGGGSVKKSQNRNPAQSHRPGQNRKGRFPALGGRRLGT